MTNGQSAPSVKFSHCIERGFSVRLCQTCLSLALNLTRINFGLCMFADNRESVIWYFSHDTTTSTTPVVDWA